MQRHQTSSFTSSLLIIKSFLFLIPNNHNTTTYTKKLSDGKNLKIINVFWIYITKEKHSLILFEHQKRALNYSPFLIFLFIYRFFPDDPMKNVWSLKRVISVRNRIVFKTLTSVLINNNTIYSTRGTKIDWPNFQPRDLQ
jgi:hypothetical protein